MLKVHLDGSGQSENVYSQLLTLSGIFASDRSWADFENKWRVVLDRHRVPYSHMRELLRGDGPFKGWEDRAKFLLVRDLFNVLGQMDRQDFIGCSLTIDLADHRNLADNRPTVKPAEAVCIDFVMNHAFRHDLFLREGNAEIFFDRGEAFMKFLERVWRRHRGDASTWCAYVATVKPADMKDVRPIQAADLLAWSANRFYASTPEESDFWRDCLLSTVIALEHYQDFYKEANLMKHPGFFDW